MAAAAGGHGVHPAQPRVGVGGPAQGSGVDIGNAVERFGRVDHRLEGTLLLRCPAKRRIPAEVSGVAHRWIQRLVANQVDPRLELEDPPAVLLAERAGDDDPETGLTAVHGIGLLQTSGSGGLSLETPLDIG